jgi:hypothetical protein
MTWSAKLGLYVLDFEIFLIANKKPAFIFEKWNLHWPIPSFIELKMNGVFRIEDYPAASCRESSP